MKPHRQRFARRGYDADPRTRRADGRCERVAGWAKADQQAILQAQRARTAAVVTREPARAVAAGEELAVEKRQRTNRTRRDVERHDVCAAAVEERADRRPGPKRPGGACHLERA